MRNPHSSQGESQNRSHPQGTVRLPVLDPASSVYDEDVEQGLKALGSLPQIGCSSCAMSGECPEYEEGALCAYTSAIRKLPIRNAKSHVAMMEHLLEWDRERTYMALMQERLMAGGQIDPRVSAQLDGHLRRVADYMSVRRGAQPAQVTLHQSVSASGPAAQGILSRILGAAMQRGGTEMENEPSRADVIDADSEAKKSS